MVRHIIGERGFAYPVLLFFLLFLFLSLFQVLTYLREQQEILHLEWTAIQDRYAAEGMTARMEAALHREASPPSYMLKEKVNGRWVEIRPVIQREEMICFRAKAGEEKGARQLVETCFALPSKIMLGWREYETGIGE